MAELNGALDPKQAEQALSPDERRIFSQIFSAVDAEGLGVVTGDVAERFLPERSRLPPETLGEIWQVADSEDKGFVTKAGFFVMLRLIGYAQNGRPISPELALKPGPLPRLEGVQMPGAAPLQAQGSGGPIPIPRLSPDKVNQYATLFEQSGAQDGVLDGIVAKQIFDRAQLPNDVLVRIWNLVDTEQRGKLSVTEFIIAMHLLASFRSGAMRALPNNLPAGLYEAAARRNIPARSPPGSRTDLPRVSAIPRSFTGQSATARTSSPLARQQYTASPAPMQAQTTGYGSGSDWAIPPNEKAMYDQQFARLDVNKSGAIGGEQAVSFFGNSKLPEADLAQVWDLADITQNGQLSQDEFAVAMHLIRQQLNGRGPLPATLPASLIPPSLRRTAPLAQGPGSFSAPSQPAASLPQPKSALDDLFGLDVTPTPTPAPVAAPAPAARQVSQSTGGSSAPAVAAFPNASPSTSTTSHFKPFVPSSSFGQSIAAPQSAVPSSTIDQSQRQIPTNDDLLGDADPEETKKFTQDTTDRANLSNQVNTLSTQTKDLQTKKAAVEQETFQATNQRREVETRLAQLRTTYEQEARELKTLQDRLNTSRAETTKLQQDFVMAQHSFQVLQDQKQQALTGFEADQKQNVSLKEQIAVVQKEIAQIGPQIEKLKADTRQQKGLVAINKKQLSSAEAEREKAKAELEAATREHTETKRDLEESNTALEASKALDSKHAEVSRSIAPSGQSGSFAVPAAATAAAAVTVAGAAAVASPALSGTSTNPFFRRAQSSSSQGGVVDPPIASPNHSAFDSFFDNSFSPATEENQSRGLQSTDHEKVDDPLFPTQGNGGPFEDVQATSVDLPSASHQPPPPPISRQMTPSILPLREHTPHTPSADSSLDVIPPKSQISDVSDVGTPNKEDPSTEKESQQATLPIAQHPDAVSTRTTEVESHPAPEILSPEPHSAFIPVPGAFPLDSPTETSEFAPLNIDSARDIPSDQVESNDATKSRSTFDALFGGFGASETQSKGKAPVSDLAFGGAQSQTKAEEFPPIQEFGQDEDDDSSGDDSDEDNVHGASAASNPVGSAIPTHPQSADESARPGLERAPSTSLPPADAQQSPPTYADTLSSENSGHRDANQFAPEYTGLLPSRQDPLASPHPHSIPNGIGGEPTIAASSVTAVEHTPLTATNQATDVPPAVPPKSIIPHDDFDDAFGDLSEAQTAEATAQDDLHSSHRDGFEDFNPTFDSVAPSKAPTLDSGAFHDFESNFADAPQRQSLTTSIGGTNSQPGPSKDEWDAMFDGFGNDKAPATGDAGLNGVVGQSGPQNTSALLDAFDVPPSNSTHLSAGQRPDLARSTTDGSHDDPIVKHLTAMGYSREISVEALEKFDYNLDKAANYLASQS